MKKVGRKGGKGIVEGKRKRRAGKEKIKLMHMKKRVREEVKAKVRK